MSRSTWRCDHCDEDLASIRVHQPGQRRLTPKADVGATYLLVVQEDARSAYLESGGVALTCPVCGQATTFRWRSVGRDRRAPLPPGATLRREAPT